MAFTAADLANFEAALVALATGKAVVSVTIGDKSISYGQRQINDVRALRDEAKTDVDIAAGRAKYVLTSTDKGL